MGEDATRTARDIARTVELTPDESITDAIGRGHTLTTALADIIDNSLDALADRITIRFVTEDERVVALRIRDNGIGMTPEVLQTAMTLGRRRTYDGEALGHFGIGLKAASLSQAPALTVYTRNHFREACAMRIRRGSFTGEVLDDDAAADGYEIDASGPASTGTVVEWNAPETISHSSIVAERRAWLEQTITLLAGELGLVFHRLIERRGVRITIDTWDLRSRLTGIPRTVEPHDPFAFTITGHPDYPTRISGTTSDGTRLVAECHVLPPRSDSASMWLLGRKPEAWQGIYIYRNDRLLQAGGWLDIRPEDKKLRLARMRLELTPTLENHLQLRHEKSGVTANPEFIYALESATDDSGIALDRFRVDAQEVLRISNQRRRGVRPVVAIKKGVPEQVIETVKAELGEREGVDGIEIVWHLLDEEQLFEFDLDRRRIVLNLYYREALGTKGSALVSTLVYLLLEENFTRQHLQQITIDQIAAWQRVVAAAVRAGDDAYDLLAEWDQPVVGDVTRLTETVLTVQADERSPSHSDVEAAVASASGPSTTGGQEESRQKPDSIDAYTPTTISGFRPGDREIIAMYRGRADIDLIAMTLGMEGRDVAMRLCALILDLKGDDIDDKSLAAMHGEPYTPEDRDRIVERYRHGETVREIAAHLYRTPFAIAWQLFASPKYPIEVPRGLLRRIDREFAASTSMKTQGPANQSLAG